MATVFCLGNNWLQNIKMQTSQQQWAKILFIILLLFIITALLGTIDYVQEDGKPVFSTSPLLERGKIVFQMVSEYMYIELY